MKNKILLISPHTDDELFGAGGTLLEFKKKGFQIKLAVMSCSERFLFHYNKTITQEQQWDEFQKCAKRLSTDEPVYFDTNNVRLEEIPMYRIIRFLDQLLLSYNPETILIPEPSYHQEHQMVYNACIAAVRPTNSNKNIKNVISYEISTSTWSDPNRSFKPNMYVDITNTIKDKINIFKQCYKLQYTEKARVTLSKKGILAHAQYRGTESGLQYAESFCLHRAILFNGEI